MLALPSEGDLAQASAIADPDAIHAARMALIAAITEQNKSHFEDLYSALKSNEPFAPDAAQAGKRALRNTCMRYLTARDHQAARTLAANHFIGANNMTDSISGLAALADMEGLERHEAIVAFYERWKDNALVLDKWFSVQAMSCRPDTLEQIQKLMTHKAFTMQNPNRVRSLIGGFAMNNPLRFHAGDGSGYAFVADRVIELDKINPQVAARMAGAFETWRRYDTKRQGMAKSALQRILDTKNLSTNTSEMVGKTLG